LRNTKLKDYGGEQRILAMNGQRNRNRVITLLCSPFSKQIHFLHLEKSPELNFYSLNETVF
jgi:hypothetical protein